MLAKIVQQHEFSNFSQSQEIFIKNEIELSRTIGPRNSKPNTRLHHIRNLQILRSIS